MNRPQTPMHKARVAVGSPPSAPLNGITELFDKPLLLWGEKPVCRGHGKSSPESKNRVCKPSRLTRSCVRSVIRATRSQCGCAQLALRAYPDDRLEDRGGTRPRFVERGHPRKPIITIPLTLYGYGNGDDAEEEGPERWCAGREHGEYKADKARRCSRLVRPLGDRSRDMLQLHPAAASRSPRATGPRPACPGRTPRVALRVNAARVFATSALSTPL